jgi:hypothetical protein
MRASMERLVIFSAYQSDKAFGVNQIAHQKLLSFLNREFLTYITGVGCYNGVLEETVAVRLPCNPEYSMTLSTLVEKAREFGQECILVRDHDGSCFIHYVKGNTGPSDPKGEYIGQWQEFSPALHVNKKAWSRFNGKYYAAV